MLKKILAMLALMYALGCCAAVDVNQASAAELDSIKGIGPAMSDRILDERKNSAFKDWADFMSRIRGIGPRSAVRLSAQGLTVGDSSYTSSDVASRAVRGRKNAKAQAASATQQ